MARLSMIQLRCALMLESFTKCNKWSSLLRNQLTHIITRKTLAAIKISSQILVLARKLWFLILNSSLEIWLLQSKLTLTTTIWCYKTTRIHEATTSGSSSRQRMAWQRATHGASASTFWTTKNQTRFSTTEWRFSSQRKAKTALLSGAEQALTLVTTRTISSATARATVTITIRSRSRRRWTRELLTISRIATRTHTPGWSKTWRN